MGDGWRVTGDGLRATGNSQPATGMDNRRGAEMMGVGCLAGLGVDGDEWGDKLRI